MGMKYTLRIPAAEQYAYIELAFEGTQEEAVAEYHSLTKAMQGQVGLDTKDFNKILDELMTTNAISGDPGIVEGFSVEQSLIIQAVKRSRARTKNK